jgi:Yip1 domain
MADDVMVTPGGEAGLSQVARVVDVFIAPSKTFTDILRSANWLLPFIIMVVIGMGSAYAVDKTIGFTAVTEQAIAKNSMSSDRINGLPADQRAKVIQQQAVITKYSTYCSFVFILIVVAIHALLLWATFNFGLGAKTNYGQVFAVIMFAGLPKALVWVLSIILLFSGVGLENFDAQNPVGTNLGYYLTAPWMKALGSGLDLFGLWSLFLLVLGMAIISKKSMGQAAAVVVGWWVIGMLLLTGISAAFS